MSLVSKHLAEPGQRVLQPLVRSPSVIAGVLGEVVRDACLGETVVQDAVPPLQLVVVAGTGVEQDAGQVAEVVQSFAVVLDRIVAKPTIPHVLDQLAARPSDRQVDASGSAQNEMIIALGARLFPGSSNSSTDIWSDYRAGGIAPAPSVANTVFTDLLPGTTLPNPLNYVETTAQLFSHLNDPHLPPTQRLRVSVLLQLLSVHEIARTLAVSDAQAIETFDLQPILDIISKGQAPAT